MLLALFPGQTVVGADSEEAGSVEIWRDQWGAPHVFASTDEGAFYGLGYATAEDRGFQMTLSLRIIQGRFSEIVGVVRRGRRRETSVDYDRKMRAFGFYRAARRVAERLDPETRRMLEAYSEGVNAWFRERANRLHPFFARFGVRHEGWTPADCVACWWHMGQFFATDGTRDLIARRNRLSGRGGGRGAARARGRGPAAQPPEGLEPLPPDDAAAVVKREDVPQEWVEALFRYAREHGLLGEGLHESPGPHFSHAWVVGGKRTSDGAPVLVSDPQTLVRNPSLFYEFHIRGRTFNARGIGAPGSPMLLIGFTPQVAWGATALGADQADLFLLKTDPAHPNAYFFDGAWRPMRVEEETIRIKGREPRRFLFRETSLGPVITPFCFARPEDGEVAVKRIPLCETNRETIEALLPMLRARSAAEFDRALEGWRFPSVNLLFGDRRGNIGYRALAAVPVRSRLDKSRGREAVSGDSSAWDWQGILPFDLLPHVMNPKEGFLFSANHRPIESWYPIPFGAMTGAGGDTIRSWRLRELLGARRRFTPEQVLQVHYDAVNPARRVLVELGLRLRRAAPERLPADAKRALEILEPWLKAGARSDLDAPGTALALEMNLFFRIVNTPLAAAYGGGQSGLAYFLKTVSARARMKPDAPLRQEEAQYVGSVLAEAWRSAKAKYGPDPARWDAAAREALQRRLLGYFESLDGFPSLDRRFDIPMPPLRVIDGSVIHCQTAQSYTQWVPLGAPDQARSILPIGASERPRSRFRRSTLSLWAEGKLHPAPLSRAALAPLTVSRKTLLPRRGERSEKG